MRKSIAHILIVAAFLAAGSVLTVALPGRAEAEIIDRIVARINGEIITFYQVKESATPYLLQNGMEPSVLDDPEQRQKIYREVLDELVDHQLLVQEADKLDLSISEDQIDQWMAQTRQQQGLSEEQFRQMIEQYGMSYDMYRDMVRQNLLKMRFAQVRIGSQVSVSDEEVDRVYREQFGGGGDVGTEIEVRHVLVQPEADSQEAIEEARREAERAYEELEQGREFEEVAREYSDDPSAEQGGYLGKFQRGDLDADFEEIAFELDEGERSEVVRTQFGFHVIEVVGVSEASGGDAEQQKAQIRAQLQEEAIQEQLDTHLDNLRDREFVDIKY